ncbi:MAG: ZIP family metal transporter [Gemmatimonadota bacterium]
MDWTESVRHLDPRLQALLAGVFTWAITAIGAALVLGTRRLPRGTLDAMLGFAAGIMIAASFWSLLAPAVVMAEAQGTPAWIPVAGGFVLGAAFLRIADSLLPHLHPDLPLESAEGPRTSWERATLIMLAITLHNIPEGLALGVAFGAAAIDGSAALYAGAIALTIGIGLQNLPEGLAVALPLRQAGMSRARSLWYGQLSAAVEPVAAVIGAAAVLVMHTILPYALSFAAGAMIFVVIEELIPEAQRNGRTDLATSAAIVGFALMTALDLGLG